MDGKDETEEEKNDRLPINLNSFALSSGIPPQVVMKWTGHSDYQAMKPYIAIAEKTKAEAREIKDGKSEYKQYEVDFIATNGIDKYYIQSAYNMSTDEKREQELKSLKKIGDSFHKIVIQGDDIVAYTNEDGFTIMGLYQFLFNNDILK